MSFKCHADWLMTFDYAGFFGKYALGITYQLSERHEFELSLGTYNIGATPYGQVNGAYRYSPWHIAWEDRIWSPFQAGLFTNYSIDGHKYFFNSPEQYPSGYYDENAIRWGLEFGSTLTFDDHQWEIAYRFRIIDTGLVAIYNNAHRDLQYYLASGLALRYRF